MDTMSSKGVSKMKIKMVTNGSLTIAQGFKLFLKKCKVKNLTPNSIKSYEDKFGKFVVFIGGGEYEIERLNSEIIDRYILYLQEQELKPVTINSYLRAIRAVFNFFSDNNYCRKIKITLLKTEKPLKEIYTDKELEILLKKPNLNKVDFNTYKIWVLENYLLGTGNRISTALEVKIGDIDFYSGTILLRKTKNRKQQIIPLSSTLAAILSEYLTHRGGDSDDYLFCNSWGRMADKRTIQQGIANYNLSKGISKTSCHAFRHTFATMYLRNGGDIYRLQKLLGHSTIQVTEQYLHLVPEDLQVNFDSLNPLSKFSRERIKLA